MQTNMSSEVDSVDNDGGFLWYSYNNYDGIQPPSEEARGFMDIFRVTSNHTELNYKEYFGNVNLVGKVGIGLVYLSMIVVCSIADTLMCVCVWRYPKMRTVMNILLTNLAVSDLLVASISAPIFMDYYLNQNWRFGQVMCSLVGYLKNSSLYVSTTSLAAIAIYRFLMIRFPYKEQGTTLCMSIVVIGIWVYSCLLALPTSIYAVLSKATDFRTSTVRYGCFEDWPPWSFITLRAYDLIVLTLAFIVPVTINSICYGGIACRLWSKNHRFHGSSSHDASQSKISTYRAFRMLLAIFIMFIICWSPYYGFLVYRQFFRSAWQEDSNRMTTSYVVESIAMSNSMFNAIINICMNEHVWTHVKLLLSWDSLCKRLHKRKVKKRRKNKETALTDTAVAAANAAAEQEVLLHLQVSHLAEQDTAASGGHNTGHLPSSPMTPISETSFLKV